MFSDTTASAMLVQSEGREEVKSIASESSFATSVGSILKARMPSMPRAARNALPFECPHCRTIECVKDSNAWIKHLHKDLQPYMCTFESCKTPNEMYEGRRQWFNHELQQHRKSWTCNGHCDRKFVTAQALVTHIRKTAPGVYSETQLPVVAEMWAGPIDVLAECPCPLCGEGITGTHQLQRHVGRHLEEIALFALPNDSTEADDDDDDHTSTGDSEHASLISDSGRLPDIVCDLCFAVTQTHYHCSICFEDNFDMCEACCAQGLWCNDLVHPMIKRSPQRVPAGRQLYYYLKISTHTSTPVGPVGSEKDGAAEDPERKSLDLWPPPENLTDQEPILDTRGGSETDVPPSDIGIESSKSLTAHSGEAQSVVNVPKSDRLLSAADYEHDLKIERKLANPEELVVTRHPLYRIKVHKRHLDIETLEAYGLPWEWDTVSLLDQLLCQCQALQTSY